MTVQFQQRLELITNVATLAVLACFVTLMVKPDLFKADSGRRMAISSLPKRLPRMDYSGVQHTILVVLSTRCKFCIDDVPFYRKLLNAQDQSRGTTRVMFLFPKTDADVENFKLQHGINGAKHRVVDFGVLGIFQTPTLLLIDSNGQAQDVIVGKVLPSDQSRLEHIAAGAS